MADTVGTYGISDYSAVRVVEVVDAKDGVSRTFQLVISPDLRNLVLTGVAPTVTVAP